MNLSGQHPTQTYQFLVNTDGTSIFDGVGAQLVSLSVTASHSQTASYVTVITVNTPIKRISSSYTATPNDTTLVCYNTSSIIVTLPPPASIGTIFNIKSNASSGSYVTISGSSGSDRIDDQTNIIITDRYSSVTVQSDGIQWWIL